MTRMSGRTGLVTMIRTAGTAVLAVGVAATAFAAGPVGVAPAAEPLTTAARLLVTASDAAPMPDTRKDAQDPAPAAPANPVVEFLKQTEIYGFVDGYYLWAFNESDPQLRNFDVKHNSFSLNYTEIAFAKPASESSRAGFRMDVGAGDAADMVNAFEPGGPDYLKHVQQAYVSYLAPVGSGLTIDVGKFVTWNGAEVIESKDNWNYSRSLLFAWAIPYYHMGARVGYAVNDKVSVTGFLVNGWNNVRDNNGDKTVGASVTVKPTGTVTAFVNYTVGKEQAADADGGVRNLFDTTVIYSPTSKLSVLGNFDYGRDSVEGDNVDWYGVAFGLKYQANDAWAVAPRYEIFKDDDGFSTGTAQTLQEVTLTAEYKVTGGLLTRFEFRSDFSDEDYFIKDHGLKSSQPTASVAFIYAFSSM